MQALAKNPKHTALPKRKGSSEIPVMRLFATTRDSPSLWTGRNQPFGLDRMGPYPDIAYSRSSDLSIAQDALAGHGGTALSALSSVITRHARHRVFASAVVVAMICITLSACASSTSTHAAHFRGTVGGIARIFRVEYDQPVSAGTALDLTSQSLAMLVSHDEAAAPSSACPLDDRFERVSAEEWQAWRETLEPLRRVPSVVKENTGVISVTFYGRVAPSEIDYVELDFQSDANDLTGWSFKCWKAGFVLFTS
jgi:hypothetical protein